MLDSGDKRVNIEESIEQKETIPANQGGERYLAVMKKANEIAGSSTTETTDVVKGMLDLMLSVTSADSANFFCFEVETNELILSCVRGCDIHQRLIGLRLNPNQVLSDFSTNDSPPVIIGDLSANKLWLSVVDPAGSVGIHNIATLPVTYNKHMLGVIQIFNYHQVETDLLMVLCNQLAIELDHRNHLTKTQQSNQRLKKLVNVLGEAAGTLDRNQLLHLVTENASELVDAERCSLFLVDPESNELIFQVAYQSKDQDISKETPKEGKKPKIKSPDWQNYKESVGFSNHQDGIFQFSNRAAITMPLTSTPLARGKTTERHILGGLLALTKNNTSFDEEDAQLMEILANQTSTFLQVAEMYESAGELFLGAIKALAAAIDAKDPYTQGHSHRVSDYSVLICKELGVDKEFENDVRIGSLLHDIGKIGIPDSVLLKNGELTVDEFEIIKQHPNTGVNILSKVQLLEPMLLAIAEHHERLDGSGYPGNLTGKNISLMGRIVAVADVFDAMTSHRPYRPAMSFTEVLTYLEENSDILFDPTCVQALKNIIERSLR
jgi:putative nucleotidyltransferase with HDIG domain